MEKLNEKKTEKFVAVCSFFAAVSLAFVSMLISTDHDIAAGVLLMCAQFLTLTATIFGINYKFDDIVRKHKDQGTEVVEHIVKKVLEDERSKRNTEQQPVEHPQG